MKISPWAERIKIEDREKAGIFVLWKDCFGGGYRSFANRETAEKFAAGEDISLSPPVLGKEIPISETAGKPRQFEKWTEKKTREEVLSSTQEGYHFGFSGKSIAAVETCFYAAWPEEKTWVPGGTIHITVPAGTQVEWYEDEFRVVIQPGMKIRRVKKGWL